MKKLLVAIGAVLIFSVPAIANDFPTMTDKVGVYNVWCRNDALHWGSVVGEAYQVRIVIGMYNAGKGDTLHAQPQVKILDTWHYFKMKPYNDADTTMPQAQMVFISMPKKKGHTWKKKYHLTWMEFALIQNTWMIQKSGKTMEYGKARKTWTVKMNSIINMLRKGTK